MLIILCVINWVVDIHILIDEKTLSLGGPGVWKRGHAALDCGPDNIVITVQQSMHVLCMYVGFHHCWDRLVSVN
jgi:hypothetical protein